MHSNQAIRVTGRSPAGAEYDSDGCSPSAEDAAIDEPCKDVIYFVKSQRHEFDLPVMLLHSQTGVWE